MNEDEADAGQDVLDNHEDEVFDLLTRLGRLIKTHSESSKAPVTKTAGRRLEHLDKRLTLVNEAVSKLTSEDDVCLVQLHSEQLATFKIELDDICKSVLISDEPEDEDLSTRQTELSQKLFDCSLIVKRLLENGSPTTAMNPSREGIKLPRTKF